MKSTADNSCFFNAVSTAAWGHGKQSPFMTDDMALPLRIAVVLAGARRIAEIMSGTSTFFRRMGAYDSKVTDAAFTTPLTMTTIAATSDVYTEGVSRAMLTLALNTITGEFTEASVFCVPLAAEAIGASIRLYIPGGSLLSRVVSLESVPLYLTEPYLKCIGTTSTKTKAKNIV